MSAVAGRSRGHVSPSRHTCPNETRSRAARSAVSDPLSPPLCGSRTRTAPLTRLPASSMTDRCRLSRRNTPTESPVSPCSLCVLFSPRPAALHAARSVAMRRTLLSIVAVTTFVRHLGRCIPVIASVDGRQFFWAVATCRGRARAGVARSASQRAPAISTVRK